MTETGVDAWDDRPNDTIANSGVPWHATQRAAWEALRNANSSGG